MSSQLKGGVESAEARQEWAADLNVSASLT